MRGAGGRGRLDRSTGGTSTWKLFGRSTGTATIGGGGELVTAIGGCDGVEVTAMPASCAALASTRMANAYSITASLMVFHFRAAPDL